MARSPALYATLTVTLDGEEIVGFPFLRRLPAPSIEQATATRAGDGVGVYTFAEVCPVTLATVTAVIFTTDQPTTLLVNDQSANPATMLPLDAGGLFCLLDTALDGMTFRLAVSNPTTETATHDTLAAATA